MMDYEKSAMDAVKCEFPNVIINGSFFHLSQCVFMATRTRNWLIKKI